VKYYDWDEVKNAKLKAEREVCFEDVMAAMDEGRVLADIDHPNQILHSGQRVLVVNINSYIYTVPYVEDDVKIFFKTIYPSRKMTKKYLNLKGENNEIL